MTDPLARFVTHELAAPVPTQVSTIAAALAARLGGVAVLYYGSTLRTGDLDGVLDFYVLTERADGPWLRRFGLRWLWPDVSFHEFTVAGRVLRAKVATMPLATFERAAGGTMLDTTVWTRFVQPAALIWSAGPSTERRVVAAVADAARTAARFAAALGPPQGAASDYWLALFRATYRTELRVEPPGRERQILAHDPIRYARLLDLAWTSDAIVFGRTDDTLTPALQPEQRRRLLRAWRSRTRMGKPLNAARLVKAAFTFEGAGRYGLWKVQRHTGIAVTLTPWRERHPVLAAPGILWRVFRASAP